MILINGQPDSRIPVTDRGLQYGDGLFETLAFRQGKLEFLDAHLKRLLHGCERLGITFNELDNLESELEILCTHIAQDSVVKIILTRGSGGRGYKVPDKAEALRILSSHPMPDYQHACHTGVTVRLCQQRLGINPSLAGIKHLNRLEQVLARSEWDNGDIHEGLMLDIKNRLIEGTMSNLFLVCDGQLMTAPLIDNGIAGIIRETVIKLATRLDIPVMETDLAISDLEKADEVFLTNSIIEIWPVTRLIEPAWGWYHGELTRRLQSALKHAKH